MVAFVAIRIVTGTVGYRRSVSLQTALRYGRDSRISASSLLNAESTDGNGRLLHISSRRRDWTSGYLARTWAAQVKAEEVVS